ncbi:hypothetical protein COCCADRAFT_103717 [Bipolaris zeicola 26-R-13]|uniref:Uncharacterized protein n=1 Tax=Cochliobolus carbonum (strain 26-R-13) TaxID=930089 RepID=W6YGS4_COCC2|nr:uncharacterized protein COCCADRAFT_103717 [Bipolaris zeicola 26-R-13]EUC30516.1 hypothetical protein COCCADRAFT_103717 [Bipolaris zeicola 26-R-13]
MKSAFAILAKNKPNTFTVSYAPEYKNFILNHVVSDASHPLHETQKRRQAERKKQGLWWHATTGVNLSRSSCVRAWARRRLRNAIKDELKERGYDDHGMFVNAKAIQDRPDLMGLLKAGKKLDLTGSLRLHIQEPLITAKYAEVRAETGNVIEAVVQAMKNGPGEPGSSRPTRKRPDWNPPSVHRPLSPRMRGQSSKYSIG